MSQGRKRALARDSDTQDSNKNAGVVGLRLLRPVKRRRGGGGEDGGLGQSSTSTAPATTDTKNSPQIGGGGGGGGPRMKQRQVWTETATEAFSEGLCQHGKNFHRILKFMQTKYRKKKDPVIPNLNKDQVRFYYYRTWHKVAALLTDPNQQPSSGSSSTSEGKRAKLNANGNASKSSCTVGSSGCETTPASRGQVAVDPQLLVAAGAGEEGEVERQGGGGGGGGGKEVADEMVLESEVVGRVELMERETDDITGGEVGDKDTKKENDRRNSSTGKEVTVNLVKSSRVFNITIDNNSTGTRPFIETSIDGTPVTSMNGGVHYNEGDVPVVIDNDTRWSSNADSEEGKECVTNSPISTPPLPPLPSLLCPKRVGSGGGGGGGGGGGETKDQESEEGGGAGRRSERKSVDMEKEVGGGGGGGEMAVGMMSEEEEGLLDSSMDELPSPPPINIAPIISEAVVEVEVKSKDSEKQGGSRREGGGGRGGGDTVEVNGVRHGLDLVALIAYFKLKKRCQGDHNFRRRLSELVYFGCTTIPSRGTKGKRKVQIRLNNCRALQSEKPSPVTTQGPPPATHPSSSTTTATSSSTTATTTSSISVSPFFSSSSSDKKIVPGPPEVYSPSSLQTPPTITVELRPLTSSSWRYVQSLSQNPRLRMMLRCSVTLGDLLSYLLEKWKLRERGREEDNGIGGGGEREDGGGGEAGAGGGGGGGEIEGRDEGRRKGRSSHQRLRIYHRYSTNQSLREKPETFSSNQTTKETSKVTSSAISLSSSSSSSTSSGLCPKSGRTLHGVPSTTCYLTDDTLRPSDEQRGEMTVATDDHSGKLTGGGVGSEGTCLSITNTTMATSSDSIKSNNLLLKSIATETQTLSRSNPPPTTTNSGTAGEEKEVSRLCCSEISREEKEKGTEGTGVVKKTLEETAAQELDLSIHSKTSINSLQTKFGVPEKLELWYEVIDSISTGGSTVVQRLRHLLTIATALSRDLVTPVPHTITESPLPVAAYSSPCRSVGSQVVANYIRSLPPHRSPWRRSSPLRKYRRIKQCSPQRRTMFRKLDFSTVHTSSSSHSSATTQVTTADHLTSDIAPPPTLSTPFSLPLSVTPEVLQPSVSDPMSPPSRCSSPFPSGILSPLPPTPAPPPPPPPPVSTTIISPAPSLSCLLTSPHHLSSSPSSIPLPSSYQTPKSHTKTQITTKRPPLSHQLTLPKASIANFNRVNLQNLFSVATNNLSTTNTTTTTTTTTTTITKQTTSSHIVNSRLRSKGKDLKTSRALMTGTSSSQQHAKNSPVNTHKPIATSGTTVAASSVTTIASCSTQCDMDTSVTALPSGTTVCWSNAPSSDGQSDGHSVSGTMTGTNICAQKMVNVQVISSSAVKPQSSILPPPPPPPHPPSHSAVSTASAAPARQSLANVTMTTTSGSQTHSNSTVMTGATPLVTQSTGLMQPPSAPPLASTSSGWNGISGNTLALINSMRRNRRNKMTNKKPLPTIVPRPLPFGPSTTQTATLSLPNVASTVSSSSSSLPPSHHSQQHGQAATAPLTTGHTSNLVQQQLMTLLQTLVVKHGQPPPLQPLQTPSTQPAVDQSPASQVQTPQVLRQPRPLNQPPLHGFLSSAISKKAEEILQMQSSLPLSLASSTTTFSSTPDTTITPTTPTPSGVSLAGANATTPPTLPPPVIGPNIQDGDIEAAILDNLFMAGPQSLYPPASSPSSSAAVTSRLFQTSSDTVDRLLRGLSTQSRPQPQSDSIQKLSRDTASVLPNFARALESSMGLSSSLLLSSDRGDGGGEEMRSGNEEGVCTRLREEGVPPPIICGDGLEDDNSRGSLILSDVLVGGGEGGGVGGGESDSTLQQLTRTTGLLDSLDFPVDTLSQLPATPPRPATSSDLLSPPSNETDVSIGSLLDFLVSPEKDRNGMTPPTGIPIPNVVDPTFRSLLEDTSVDYIQKFREMASQMNTDH